MQRKTLEDKDREMTSDLSVEKNVLHIIASRHPSDVECLKAMNMGREYFNNVFHEIDYPLGMTIFHYAVKYGTAEMVSFMLHNGAKPNITDKNGFTPLFDAIGSNRKAIATLLEFGADANARAENGLTPLEWAINQSTLNIKYIIPLLASGASPLTRNYEGKTPYEQCIKKRDVEIAMANQFLGYGHAGLENNIAGCLERSKRYDDLANLISKYDITNIIQSVAELTCENKRLSQDVEQLKKTVAALQEQLSEQHRSVDQLSVKASSNLNRFKFN